MVAMRLKGEHALYSQMLKCYQMKKYRKGIHLADGILTNRESSLYCKALAWKGLFLGLLGRPESGIKIVLKGLIRDNNSTLCWHVYGKLQTIRGDYRSAVECYTNALVLAPENPGVSKDLALTQAHLGDFSGFKRTTGEMLMSVPRSTESWIMYVTASEAAGDPGSALSVLSSLLESSRSELMDTNRWKHSELLLFQNDLLQEVGETTKALNHLLENSSKICGATITEETLVNLYLQTGQHQEAVPIAFSLLKRNPNNRKYYDNLFYAMRLQTDASKANTLKQLLEDFGNEPLPILLFLKYGSGKQFAHHLTKYVKIELNKGSTNLFQSLKSLLRNYAKRSYIKSLLNRHHTIVSKEVTNCPGVEKTQKELFSNILCSARIYDFEGNQDQALEAVKKAILLRPLAPEGYMAKAKFYKHALNPIEACRAMEKAQRLDPTDRWLQTKLIKYLLRANLNEQAEKLYEEIHKYDEPETVGELWYLYERAASYRRLGKNDQALAVCNLVEAKMVSMKNELFSMHTVCVEKSLLRVYKEFLFEIENLRRNKFYLKTADLAVEIALQQQDARLALFKKQRRTKCVGKTSLPLRKSTRGNNQGSKDRLAAVESSDSDSETPQNVPHYFQDNLLSLRHYLTSLQTYQPNRIETQIKSYEFYRRLKRPLLMMQSLLKARKINQDHQSLLFPMVHFYSSLIRWAAKELLPRKKLAILLEMGRKALWKNRSMEKVINMFLRAHGRDVRYMLEGGKALYKIQPSKKAVALKLASYTGKSATHRDVRTCRKVLDEMLKGSFGPDSGEAEEYRKKCAEIFKNTTAFDIDAVKNVRAQDFLRTYENREINSINQFPDLQQIKDHT